MSQQEYKDRQELEEKLTDNFEKIEMLGEEQEGHQKDLEYLQKLKTLKGKNGLYTDSNSITNSIEVAISTRESNVETCKEQIKEVSDKVKPTLESLKKNISRATERVGKMEDIANNLNHQDVVVNINIDINQEKGEIDDAKGLLEKGTDLLKHAGGIMSAGVVTANAIATLVSALQSIGLMR
jgi:chromosome segregation ATPase